MPPKDPKQYATVPDYEGIILRGWRRAKCAAWGAMFFVLAICMTLVVTWGVGETVLVVVAVLHGVLFYVGAAWFLHAAVTGRISKGVNEWLDAPTDN